MKIRELEEVSVSSTTESGVYLFIFYYIIKRKQIVQRDTVVQFTEMKKKKIP